MEQIVQNVECCYSKPQVMRLFCHNLTDKILFCFIYIHVYIRFILVLWNVFSEIKTFYVNLYIKTARLLLMYKC